MRTFLKDEQGNQVACGQISDITAQPPSPQERLERQLDQEFHEDDLDRWYRSLFESSVEDIRDLFPDLDKQEEM
jgi:hypothetical protein